MNLQEKKALLLLSQAQGVGAMRLRALVARFHSPENVLNASTSELSKTPHIGQTTAEAISKFLHSPKRSEAEARIEQQFEKLEKLNASLITLWDHGYPNRLKEIYDAPTFLFVRGTLTARDEKSIAVVGTRYPTDYGKNAAKKIVSALVKNGFCVISGLAIGIDAVAHNAALDNGGRTVAVLGNGIDNIYTDVKGKFYPKILENGAIISEEWIGVVPMAENFPKRNRIISGLSLGAMIVESDIKGGAMITAKYALDQNRDVFALPGSIFSPKSNGTNELIRDGRAKLVLTPDDILSEYPEHKASFSSLQAQLDAAPNLSSEERKIFALLSNDPLHIDDIAEQSGLDVSDALVLLFELEMKNLARQLAGKMFQKV
jgi:DNA processing protein